MSDTEQVDRLTEQTEDFTGLSNGVTQQSGSPTGQPNGVSEQPDRLTRQSQWSNWTVLAMIILCFFLIVRFRPFETRQSTGEGKTLPRLELQPLSGGGQPVTLADLTGRVVLINFWGTWSSLSRDELLHLAALEKQFRDQPAFRLFAVSCGRRAKEDLEVLREDTRALLEQKNIDLRTYADPGGVSRSAVDRVVGLNGYPTTLILDRWGRIRKAWTGFQPGLETEMRQLITQLLNEG